MTLDQIVERSELTDREKKMIIDIGKKYFRWVRDYMNEIDADEMKTEEEYNKRIRGFAIPGIGKVGSRWEYWEKKLRLLKKI